MDQTERALDYIHGRLDAAEVAAFEAEIAASPDLQAEVALIEAARSKIAATLPDTPSVQQGWADLKSKIDTLSMPQPANSNMPIGFLKVAGIAAAAIFVWQVAVVPLSGLQGPDQFTTASAIEEGFALRVAFTEGADIAQVSALLRDVGASVTDGPSAIGLYTVVFENDAARDAAEQKFMENAALVTAVARP